MSTNSPNPPPVLSRAHRLRMGILVFPKVEPLDFGGPLEVFSVANLILNDYKSLSDNLYPYIDIKFILAEAETASSVLSPENEHAASGSTSRMCADAYGTSTSVAASTLEPIMTMGRMRIIPDWRYDQITSSTMSDPKSDLHFDILVIPGGPGYETLLQKSIPNNAQLHEWIKMMVEHPQLLYLLSICTGTLVTAQSGVLNNLNQATTHHSFVKQLQSELPTSVKVVPSDNMRYIDTGKIIMSGGISAGIDASLHLAGRLYGLDMINKCRSYMEYYYGVGPSEFDAAMSTKSSDNTSTKHTKSYL